jgi:sulfopropanediol 3-dehydrogenase
MPVRFLKTAPGLPPSPEGDTAGIVAAMLARMRAEGEAAARDYAERLDGWSGDIVVDPDHAAAAGDDLPQALKDAIGYAHDNIRRFADAQRASATDFEVQLRPGLVAGQRQIPLNAVGAYVPGGRYAHIASALMTIATARAAGVGQVVACSPPRPGIGIAPAVLYAMTLAGADRILCLGGVPAVAAMAQGLFGGTPADILVGPGNQFVAEAMVLADAGADPVTVAWDLAGQAEHGANSPVWLVTDDAALAREVLRLVPLCIAELPDFNAAAARASWEALGEVMVCDNREEMAAMADDRGPEHLHVQAADPGWWRDRLRVYGSLFLGAQTTVAFGDKAAGPNHVLPTSGAARYTGGLSVHKFLKTVTWQTADDVALPDLARATAIISRAEGMEGHARTADIRLAGCRSGSAKGSVMA